MGEGGFGQLEKLICLVRHAEAKSGDEDPQRSLTERGRRAAERMAAWACAAGFRIDEIRHSGKTRAAQTADAFAQRLHPAPPSIAASGLDPNDDVRPVGEQLRRESKTVMLVGHLPFLSRLVGYLVAGDPDQEVVLFEASSLVVLSREDSQWLVACAMRPDLL